MPIILDGSSLTIEKLVAIARDHEKVELAPEALERIKVCRAMLEEKLANKEVMYGTNTGIGEFSETMLNDEQVKEFQKYLIYNHAAGIGEPAPIEEVRAALAGRINVIEHEESLTFTNLGSFVPGDVRRVVMEDAPEEHYRNRFLATAMFNLKMVDTAGGGIRKLFLFQRQRFFPMPDYDLSDSRVKVKLTGKVLDMDYARLLARDGGLSLQEIMALDKVQKHRPLDADEERLLKEKGLIEGRKPNFYIAKPVAQKVGQKASYSKNRAFDKQYYLDLICKAIEEHGSLTRKDIDELLWKKLPDWMDEKQRKNRITNLITELRQGKRIENRGTFKESEWVLLK